MGNGTCIDGIKAAIDEKKNACKQQQSIDAAKDAEQDKVIRDMLGENSSLRRSMVRVTAELNVAKYAPLHYAAVCGGQFEPTCQNFSSLCAVGSGCNQKLTFVQQDLELVQNYFDLWKILTCIRVREC